MTLIGLLWAMLAPLLLLPLAWVLVKLLRLRWPASLGIVAVVTLVVWLPERLAFHNRCVAMGEPTILKTVNADGFFLDDPTANSFGMRYLQKPGFLWLEARSIYNRSKFTRYDKDGEKINQREIDDLTAQYVLTSTLSEEGSWNVSRTEISDLSSGEKLAWAESGNFDGGIAKWVLGAYGTSHCPSDSDTFKKMYELAWETLRKESP